MSYQKHNFEAGAVLFASQLNDMDSQIEYLSNQESSFSDDFKTALLNCFENVAWINENGQTYYDALYDSLYPDNMWFITNALTGCVTSNNATNILKNNSYVATITANEGYTLDGATVSITMGGNDVTNLYYSSGSINIPNVTGNLVITVTAVSDVVSISAVFTQGSAIIYDTDSLDTLQQYLVVTAIYADSTTTTVSNYTLSGTLEEGISTITVSYGGKTDTFNVTVTHRVIGWYYPFNGSILSSGTEDFGLSGVQEYDIDKADLYVKPTIYSDDQYLKDSIGGFNEFLSTSVTYDLPNGEQEVLDATVLKNWIAMREDGVQYLNEEIVRDHVNAYIALLAMKVDDVHNTRVLHSTLQGDVAFPSETWGHMIDQEAESAALLADIQNHNVTEREPAYSLNSTYAENFGWTYVEVDIENQTCFYYEDGELLWSSECVTGTGSNEDRETVRGIFSILNKEQGRTLRGPQLEDGSYTYESYVNYWMQFYEGYGLHDATWRSNYEFGGDTYWYSGSHGCVNLPYYAAESLYFMVSIGTYVLVF